MKFYIGDLVKVKRKMPSNMSHFVHGQLDIVATVNGHNVMLTNSGGWYPFEVLRLIRRNPNTKLLKRMTKEEGIK